MELGGSVDLFADGSFTGFIGNIMYQSAGFGTGGGTTPAVTGFSPSSGATGATVTITGTNLGNFVPAPLVKFGTTIATVSSATATSVVVTVPASLAAGNSTITISNGDGTGAITVGTFNVTVAGGGTSTGQMGGAIQGTPLSLTNTVTTPWTTYLGEMTTDGTNYYVADRTFFRVTKFNPITGVQSTLAGAFTVTAGFVDGTGAAAQFGSLKGITTDGTNLYVSDTGNHSIRKIVIATGVVTTLAGSGVAGFADGVGSAAQFNQPNGITTDNTNLFVADYSNNRIRKIVIATGVVTTLVGSGVGTRVDGTGTAATFSNPYVITTDGTNLYESDLFGGVIRKIVIATGTVTTMLTGGSGLAFTSDVRGITTDGTNLYITDNSGNVVRKIVIATGVMSLLAGGATAATATVDGVGVAAKFNAPGAITTDGTSLYVADGQLFRKIQ